MITPRLNWLFNIDPEWVEARLLDLADQTNADAEAFWGGYFWGARTPQLPLYQRLKPFFFALARNGVKRRDHANKLAGMLLAGWGGEEEAQEPERLIRSEEHTSELQSLMRISYAVFCLKKKPTRTST